ncbi:hypothetical protein L1887_23363 [Cichorium endivia]|nr:hypothetical protein L1887_23363 [Cichorium endivia]
MVEMMAHGTDFTKELESNRKRYLESEQKSKINEIKCTMLEIEVEKLNKKNKELEEQIARIQKLMSDEEKGKETIVDLTAEENEKDEFLRLTIEKKFLECEKVKAETELHFWKEKVKQLVFQVCELESKLNTKGVNENCSKVKRRLPFEEYECSNKKFAPSTPGFAPPPSSNVIHLSDEDEDLNQIPKVKKLDSILKNIAKDDFKFHSQISTKQKTSSNVVQSDDESSYDDNAPICTLIKKDNGDKVKDKLNENKVTSNKIKRNEGLNLKWDLEGEMLTDFGKNPELCMKAVCALYRQQTANEKACKGIVTLKQESKQRTDRILD